MPIPGLTRLIPVRAAPVIFVAALLSTSFQISSETRRMNPLAAFAQNDPSLPITATASRTGCHRVAAWARMSGGGAGACAACGPPGAATGPGASGPPFTPGRKNRHGNSASCAPRALLPTTDPTLPRDSTFVPSSVPAMCPMPEPFALWVTPMVNGPSPGANPPAPRPALKLWVVNSRRCGGRPRITLVIAAMNPEQS